MAGIGEYEAEARAVGAMLDREYETNRNLRAQIATKDSEIAAIRERVGVLERKAELHEQSAVEAWMNAYGWMERHDQMLAVVQRHPAALDDLIANPPPSCPSPPKAALTLPGELGDG